jgi:hypothetical protein
LQLLELYHHDIWVQVAYIELDVQDALTMLPNKDYNEKVNVLYEMNTHFIVIVIIIEIVTYFNTGSGRTHFKILPDESGREGNDLRCISQPQN